MVISIIDSNEQQINQAVPVLSNAFRQIKDFADQLQTAVDISGTDPATLGIQFPFIVKTTGLDAAAVPATKTYIEWSILISWDAVGLQWQIDSIIKTCDNQEDATL